MQCFGSLWRTKDTASAPSISLRKLRKMSIEAQYDEFEEHSSWQKLFLVLKTKSEKQTLDFTTDEAKKADSKLRNRFRDVLPYDQTRVLLQPCQRKSCDYINASFVQVPSARRSYICSQGPLTSTMGHLWEMIWTHNSPAIVMLNSLIEKGTPTCATYWPQDINSSLTFDDSDECHAFCVTLLQQTETSVFVSRKLKITRRRKNQQNEEKNEQLQKNDIEEKIEKIEIEKKNEIFFEKNEKKFEKNEEIEERIISQFHFTNWPDFGVPQCPDEFLDFLFAVRNSGCFDVMPNQQECKPVVVHCTAGIGRTGTFVLVDVCLALLSLYRAVDIPTQLLELRTMRMGFVQTAEQLRFCFQAIIRGKKRIAIQTPAASPSISHRPNTLQLSGPESPPESANLSPVPDSGSPKSPRRELLRQDGRTPSVDNAQEVLQTGKRQKTDDESSPEPFGRVQPVGSEPALISDANSTAVSPVPTHVNGGEMGDHLTDQQKRDATLRQKRHEHNEHLRQKVETIKRHQEESKKQQWKPWMSIVATVGVATLAILITYQKLQL